MNKYAGRSQKVFKFHKMFQFQFISTITWLHVNIRSNTIHKVRGALGALGCSALGVSVFLTSVSSVKFTFRWDLRYLRYKGSLNKVSFI